MAIFTASRSENTEEQNDKGNAEIRSELKRLKVGYRIAKSQQVKLAFLINMEILKKIGNEFHPDKVSDYMTEIKGKSFVFEEISDYVPQGIVSFIDAQKAYYSRKNLK